MKLLVPVAWTLWGASVLGLFYLTVLLSTERTHSPEGGGGIAIALVVLLFLLAGAGGVGLYWATTRQSVAAVATITAIFAFPFVGLLASPIVKAIKQRSFDEYNSREGDFGDPRVNSIAAHISAANPVTLREALNGQPPPSQRDRAGNDLLAFAIRRFRFDKGSLECVRVLLAAGADPNSKDPESGWPPLVDVGDSPELVRTLVESGADIEALADRVSAVVRFTSNRQWDSAIYLVEKGARLDTSSPEGLSLDYYIKDWKDGIFGEHPEGWDRLRAAIAKRRATPQSP